MKPSTRIVMRASAAARYAPAIIAISKPPKVASTSTQVGAACRQRRMMRQRRSEHVALFREPGIVETRCHGRRIRRSARRTGGSSDRLPPTCSQCPSRRSRSRWCRAPRDDARAPRRRCIAASAWSRVIAGSCAKLRVPAATGISTRPSVCGNGVAMPALTTSSVDTGHAAQRIDRRPARQKVRDHLRGHRLRIGAHAFLRDAMVAGEHDHRRALHRGMRGSLDQAHLPRERFEPPEAAGRLGLRIDEVLQCGCAASDRAVRRRARRGDEVIGLRVKDKFLFVLQDCRAGRSPRCAS